MWLRTDKVSGTITCGFGIVMIVWASLGLVILAIQRAMLETMPQRNPPPGFPAVADIMHAAHGVMYVYLLIAIAGGIVYAVAGFYVRRGSSIARRVAQANALAGYLWIATYLISTNRLASAFMEPFAAPADTVPEPMVLMFQLFAILFYALAPVSTFVSVQISAAFPTALLYILSRPRDQAARLLPEPAEQA